MLWRCFLVRYRFSILGYTQNPGLAAEWFSPPSIGFSRFILGQRVY
ncbi:MAG: hypothetical protein LBU25_08210 [Treponema sp.]|nr:hypothetical protein [Treponema sp.]